jgi:hypothetical protein
VLVGAAPHRAFATHRPHYRVLESERVDLLASFEDAFERFSNDLRHKEMMT